MAKRKRDVEIEYFIGEIERSALSYSVNHHRLKWDSLRPYSRTLHLYGRMLYPANLKGVSLEASLLGQAGLKEEVDDTIGPVVASLKKRDNVIDITALIPFEFVTTLSAAFHDGRMHILAARGPTLSRRSSALTNLAFEQRAYFEDYWGAPLDRFAD